MSLVAAPADRRFRRAHVKPSRKRGVVRTLVRRLVRFGLVAVVLAYGAYRASAVVADARMLQVDRIVVRGNERLSRSETLAVLDGLRGQSLVWTDLDVWSRRVRR